MKTKNFYKRKKVEKSYGRKSSQEKVFGSNPYGDRANNYRPEIHDKKSISKEVRSFLISQNLGFDEKEQSNTFLNPQSSTSNSCISKTLYNLATQDRTVLSLPLLVYWLNLTLLGLGTSSKASIFPSVAIPRPLS